MSRKKQPSGLVDVHGRPLARAPKAVPPPAADETRQAAATAASADGATYGDSWMDRIYANIVGESPFRSFSFSYHAPKPRTLRDAVGEQLTAIHDALPSEWSAQPELPPPPVEEMDRYDNAREWALRHCPHQNVANTLYASGEFQCRDCGRYLRGRQSMFGWTFSE